MNNASTDEVEDIITLDHSEILEYQKNRFISNVGPSYRSLSWG